MKPLLVFDRKLLSQAIKEQLESSGSLFSGRISYFNSSRRENSAFQLRSDELLDKNIDDVAFKHVLAHQDAFFFQKSKDWSQEVEFRWLILGNSHGPEYVSFGDSLVAVIRGGDHRTAAVMPDHVHLAIRVHRDKAEEMIAAFQDTTRSLLRERRRRTPTHPVWGGPGWKVFINTERHLRTTIRYIEENPIKARRPAQKWDFVTPYDGWLPGLHPDRKKK